MRSLIKISVTLINLFSSNHVNFYYFLKLSFRTTLGINHQIKSTENLFQLLKAIPVNIKYKI